MIESVSFKTKARTVDHLGREQIADAPTAVSELWKNSYDAYARNVGLHVFDGAVRVAALVDDGHGMTNTDFIERWLVIGTDAKLSDSLTPAADMFDLPHRVKQGQKGIGRLSCAALGRLALILSKKQSFPFVGALVDWRLFENPFLLLDDISLPVVSFDNAADLAALLPDMRDRLVGNIWGDGPSARTERLTGAWDRYSAMESRSGRPTTKEAIEAVVVAELFSERHFSVWSAWREQVGHGTAIFMVDLNFDLEALVSSRGESAHDNSVNISSQRMRETLSSFTDPFSRPQHDEKKQVDAEANEFHYGIHVWTDEGESDFLSDARELDYANFEMLEHIIDGHVDDLGVFRGRVKAFGEWLDETITIPPDTTRMPKRSDGRVGPFRFKVGAYEPIRNNSTLTDEQHAFIKNQAETFSGLFVFRDDLRVQPFGRPEYDFFEIERRRTEQAGREFWSHRRMFGSIDISSHGNSNLRDKAGREGLLDNLAAKVFREIVQNILMTSARRFFGYDSEERKPKIAKIRAGHAERKAEEQQRKLADKRRNEFRTRVRRNASVVDALLKELRTLAPQWQQGEAAVVLFASRREKLMALEERLHMLYVGEPPQGLQAFKDEYASYSSAYRAAASLVEDMTTQLLERFATVNESPPAELLRKEIDVRSSGLARVSAEYAARATSLLSEARDGLEASSVAKRHEFER